MLMPQLFGLWRLIQYLHRKQSWQQLNSPVSKTWMIHSSHKEQQQINPSIKIKGLRLNDQEGATILGRRRNGEKFADVGWSLPWLIVPAQLQTVPHSCQAAATTVSTIPCRLAGFYLSISVFAPSWVPSLDASVCTMIYLDMEPCPGLVKRAQPQGLRRHRGCPPFSSGCPEDVLALSRGPCEVPILQSPCVSQISWCFRFKAMI